MIAQQVRPEVGMGVTELGWSDRHPWEIIEVVSDRKIKLRSMTATRDPEWKPEVVAGGFSGHCVNNNEQRWKIEPNPEGKVKFATLRKNGKWIWVGEPAVGSCAAGLRLGEARYFYDYNF